MMSSSLPLVVAALCGCATMESIEPVETREHEPVATPPPRTSCKPEAPVTIGIVGRELAPGVFELEVEVMPTKAVGSVELIVLAPAGATFASPPRAAFGATRSGEVRTLVATVTAANRAITFDAIARVPVEGITMSRNASFTFDRAAPPQARHYTLPDGERARELRQ